MADANARRAGHEDAHRTKDEAPENGAPENEASRNEASRNEDPVAARKGGHFARPGSTGDAHG
jgi:hypothetical protein